MSDVRKVIDTVLAPAQLLRRSVAGAVGSLRRQAPGARMVGEFVVKSGANEVSKRMRGQGK